MPRLRYGASSRQTDGRHVMNAPHNSPIQFSLRQMFGVTGFVAFTLGMVSYTGSTAVGVHLSLCLIGWVMWRIVHVGLGGLVLIILGADILACRAVDWIVNGSEDFLGAQEMFNWFASLLVLAGAGWLLIKASKKQGCHGRQAAVAVVALSSLIAWWAVVPTLGNNAIARRRAADNAANNKAVADAIAMVEQVVKQSGTTPDEDELIELLGEPLPSVRWDGISREIRYRRMSETTYQLSYLDPGGILFSDIITYDSNTPKRGWYRVPF